jgi:aryl-alcohol dehydrogenase-like predicted oxidoreductase
LFSGILTEKYLDRFPEGTRMGIEGFEWLKERNLTPAHIEKVRDLNKLAQEIGVSLPKLAIAWCLQNPNVSTAILGASRPEQLKETLSSFDVVPLLTPEINARIEGILQNKPQHPMF